MLPLISFISYGSLQCSLIKTAEHLVFKQQTDSPFPRNKYRLLWHTLTKSWHTLTMLPLSPRHVTSSELLHCTIPASLCSSSYPLTLFDIMPWSNRSNILKPPDMTSRTNHGSENHPQQFRASYIRATILLLFIIISNLYTVRITFKAIRLEICRSGPISFKASTWKVRNSTDRATRIKISACEPCLTYFSSISSDHISKWMPAT